MHWVKKVFVGLFIGLFLFITMSFLSAAGLNPFAEGFVSIAGFMLLLCMGVIELNFITYG